MNDTDQQHPRSPYSDLIGYRVTRRDIGFCELELLVERKHLNRLNVPHGGSLASLIDTTEEQLDQIVALQFKGVHHFLQAFVERMIAQDPTGGSLISLSSATPKALINNHAAYIGTKTGSEALIRCIANDYGHYGIRDNTVSPAFTESPMTAQSFAVPGLVEAFLPKYPLGRLNTAQDVANACLWLCGDEAFVSGQNIQPNGGLTLRGNPQAVDIERSVGAAMAAAAAKSG